MNVDPMLGRIIFGVLLIPLPCFPSCFRTSRIKFSFFFNFVMYRWYTKNDSISDLTEKRGAEPSELTLEVFSKVVDASFKLSFEGTTLAILILQKWLR
jgi:hypothetical protein